MAVEWRPVVANGLLSDPTYVCMLCAVQHFDTDGDGYITKEELHEALSRDTDNAAQLRKDIQQVLQEADSNHDDRIDYTVSSGSA